MPTQMGEFDFIAVLISIIIGLGVTNLLSGAGPRVLSPPKEPDRRSPHGFDRGDAAHPDLELVGDFFLANGDQLDLREVPGPDCLGWSRSSCSPSFFIPRICRRRKSIAISGSKIALVITALSLLCVSSIFYKLRCEVACSIPFGISRMSVITRCWAPLGLALRRRGYDRFFAWYQLITHPGLVASR